MINPNLRKCINSCDETSDILSAARRELSELEMSDDFSGCILNEIRAALTNLGCSCGPDAHKATPPMFYREWLLCVVQKRERRIKELETELKMLQNFINNREF